MDLDDTNALIEEFRAFARTIAPLNEIQLAALAQLDDEQFERYREMRAGGQSHNIALVLASKSFPATRTDVEFNRGRCNGNQFEGCPARGDYLRACAEAAGVSTTGKWYCGGLAEYPGDPAAWVSGKSDVLRVARERNLTVHGLVEHEGREVEPIPDVAVAPELIEAEVAGRLEDDPGLDPEALRSDLLALRSGAVNPNPLLVSDPGPDYEDYF